MTLLIPSGTRLYGCKGLAYAIVPFAITTADMIITMRNVDEDGSIFNDEPIFSEIEARSDEGVIRGWVLNTDIKRVD